MARNTLYLAQRVPYPPNKGEKIRTFHQIKFLIEQGHNIYILSPYASDDELDCFTQLEEAYPVTTQKAKLKPFIFRVLSGLLSNKPLSVSNFYCRKLQEKIDNLLSTKPIHNIVCTSSSMAEYVFNSRVIGRPGIESPKLVMDFMDLDSDKWNQYKGSSAIPMKWVYGREASLLSEYEIKINREFDVSFFISQAEVDLFCRRTQCDKKPLVIGNGIDGEEFSPTDKTVNSRDGLVFLFTGVMDYRPNIDAVLWFTEQVWPLVTSKYPGSVFIIAGMNPVKPVTDLANIQGIEVTGFVDDILPYYHRSDYFVAPLRIARGVQNKILQAFSCGLPVISTSMGAEGIQCGDGKDIMIADTPEAFMQSIETASSDPGVYLSIRRNALELTDKFYSWNAVLSDLNSILDGNS